MTVDLTLQDQRWASLAIDALADAAAVATLVHLGLDPQQCEVSILACDDKTIAELNRDFRGKPDPTNVLSWPAEDLAAEIAGGGPSLPQVDFTGEIVLGDIAIAYETCLREAGITGKPLGEHVTHLIIHGLLHLLGYDHIRDPDATLMEGLEVEILGRMGLNDPYREAEGS